MGEAKQRHIVMIAAALPPQLDGIGDYSALVAAELAKTTRVTILTGTDAEHDPIPGVELMPTFAPGEPKSVHSLVAPIARSRPEWVLLQYNPFSYGKRGWNPYLPGVLGQIRKESPQTRIAVMAHETFVPVLNLPFAVMAAYQRAQYFAIGRRADVMFLSIEKWANKFQKWFPQIPVRHIPVGSNLPMIPIAREEARRRLNIGPETFVVGLFGTAHPSRLFPWVGAAMGLICRERPDALLLYIGPHGEAVRETLSPETPLLAEGALPAEEASRRFAAMDIALSPYSDGVSTRRGAFMAGIQHGIPTVGTRGIHTDSMLLEREGEGWLLPPATEETAFQQNVLRLLREPETRARMGAESARLYRAHFDWEPICRRMTDEMAKASKTV